MPSFSIWSLSHKVHFKKNFFFEIMTNMLSIQDKYEYNQKNLLDWNPVTDVLTFKGHVKTSPNEVVNIKIIPNGLGKVYEEEVQKLKSLENAGIIAMMEQIQIKNNFYLIFSNISRTKPNDTQPMN